jgi:hypothetical protein
MCKVVVIINLLQVDIKDKEFTRSNKQILNRKFNIELKKVYQFKKI